MNERAEEHNPLKLDTVFVRRRTQVVSANRSAGRNPQPAERNMLASRAAAAATFVRVVRFIASLRAPLVVAGLALLLDLIESSRAESSGAQWTR